MHSFFIIIHLQLSLYQLKMKFITSFDLKAMFDRGDAFQLIDTRDSDKFEEGHLPAAINIPQIELPEKIDLITRDIPVIIYCQYGVKSQAPYLFLTEKHKFRNIFILDGGMYQWETDIDPNLETGK